MKQNNKRKKEHISNSFYRGENLYVISTNPKMVAGLKQDNDNGQKCWQHFVNRYERAIKKHIARSLYFNESDVDDLTSEVYQRVYKYCRTENFDEKKGKFRGLLQVIIKRAVSDYYRSKNKKRITKIHYRDKYDSPIKNIDRSELVRLIDEHMEKLDKICEKILDDYNDEDKNIINCIRNSKEKFNLKVLAMYLGISYENTRRKYSKNKCLNLCKNFVCKVKEKFEELSCDQMKFETILGLRFDLEVFNQVINESLNKYCENQKKILEHLIKNNRKWPTPEESSQLLGFSINEVKAWRSKHRNLWQDFQITFNKELENLGIGFFRYVKTNRLSKKGQLFFKAVDEILERH